MDYIALLSAKERLEIFSETGAQKGMTTIVVEKDFWVTWTLSKIFGNNQLNRDLRFKGGTTLSKVFKAIERFSEDIDLILNWNKLTEENPTGDRSKKQQVKLNEEIRESGRKYIKEILLPIIENTIYPICSCHVDEIDNNVINIIYPASSSDGYIRPEIRLEIGPLASWLPFDSHEIESYAAEIFPHLFKNKSCTVQVIKAERTFWEKATILHHEANRPPGSTQPSRYSRHYYDLAQLSRTPIKDSALAQLDILESVVEFKKRFFPRGWADYDHAKPGSFKLMPPEHVLSEVIKDYQNMKNMIYGTYPDFSEISYTLQELESEINSLRPEAVAT